MARVVGWHIGHFNVQGLGNTAWAFATAGETTPTLLDPFLCLDTMEMKDAKPHKMLLARSLAECRMSDFNAQVLANTAWAFATVSQLDTTMMRAMSWVLFEWIRGYKAIRQI